MPSRSFCADRPAGVEDVVDQQNPPVVDRERDVGALDDRLRADRMAHQVVAVERDVERAGRHVMAADLLDAPRQPAGERHAPAADADQRQLLDPAMALDDLVRDPGQGLAHAIAVHHKGHGGTSAEI
jgi:hypothetical protein